jgi:hypothetical protein
VYYGVIGGGAGDGAVSTGVIQGTAWTDNPWSALVFHFVQADIPAPIPGQAGGTPPPSETPGVSSVPGSGTSFPGYLTPGTV